MLLTLGEMLSDRNSVNALDLAIGLKELLLDKGFFTPRELLSIPPGELALILGVDFYIAKLIIMAARRQAKTAWEMELISQDSVL